MLIFLFLLRKDKHPQRTVVVTVSKQNGLTNNDLYDVAIAAVTHDNPGYEVIGWEHADCLLELKTPTCQNN